MRIISYGGGVQSTALVVLAAQGKIGKVDAVLFANVGDDSEHPDTLRYVRDVAIPWADAHGLPIHTLQRKKRNGDVETLREQLTRPGSRSIGIPVRMHLTGAPGRRKCTTDFKIKVISKWLKHHEVTAANPAHVLIGFSTDEMHRVSNRRPNDTEVAEYPLLDLGLDRTACKALIASAGLPVPPKSACYFCPFSRPSDWLRMRRNTPELFSAAVELERTLIARSLSLGRNPVYFSRFCMPLDEAIVDNQPDLPLDGPGGETCDEGYCWT